MPTNVTCQPRLGTAPAGAEMPVAFDTNRVSSRRGVGANYRSGSPLRPLGPLGPLGPRTVTARAAGPLVPDARASGAARGRAGARTPSTARDGASRVPSRSGASRTGSWLRGTAGAENGMRTASSSSGTASRYVPQFSPSARRSSMICAFDAVPAASPAPAAP